MSGRRFNFVMEPSDDHLFDFSSDPPPGWRHPVSGRIEWEPSADLLRFGRYLRRARYFAHLSQEDLASRAGVSQSNISRLERGLAPATGSDRIARIGAVLGKNLPLGFCPHTHMCPWQPIVDLPPPPDPSAPPEHGLKPVAAANPISLEDLLKHER